VDEDHGQVQQARYELAGPVVGTTRLAQCEAAELVVDDHDPVCELLLHPGEAGRRGAATACCLGSAVDLEQGVLCHAEDRTVSVVKYARLEAERRFLLDALPDLADARVLRITDRYVHGTRMRLRVVHEGDSVVRKLGQKVPRSTSTNEHTTLYLDEAEHALLQALPADELSKTRYVLDGWAFDEHPTGLLLAETEDPGEPWFPYVREVTEDLAFTGAVLARGAR
jgi:hypothetical protein